MAAVYKSRCCLVWFCNPAVTRIPDAHFFWEAKYNGTEVIAISPDFTPSAMHASKWVNPKPGTDIALAMGMVQVLLADGLIDWDYIREQTDLPFLVRADNGKFLRESDFVARRRGAHQPVLRLGREVAEGRRRPRHRRSAASARVARARDSGRHRSHWAACSRRWRAPGRSRPARAG